MPDNIQYRINEAISALQFRELLQASGLAERRPVEDMACLTGMLDNANLVITAWHTESDAGLLKLIGIARSVTDFHYCCYLSDLAVHSDFQKHGIGKQLQRLTQSQLGPHGKLILLAAPAAADYYRHIGFEHNDRCWVLDRHKSLS